MKDYLNAFQRPCHVTMLSMVECRMETKPTRYQMWKWPYPVNSLLLAIKKLNSSIWCHPTRSIPAKIIMPSINRFTTITKLHFGIDYSCRLQLRNMRERPPLGRTKGTRWKGFRSPVDPCTRCTDAHWSGSNFLTTPCVQFHIANETARAMCAYT